MSSLAPSLEGQSSDGALAGDRELTSDVLKSRVVRRRQMLTIQAASYALNSVVLLIYAYAGTLSIVVPSTYFLSGIMLTGFFAVLSETNINDGSMIIISRSFRSAPTSRSSLAFCWLRPRS